MKRSQVRRTLGGFSLA